MLLRFSPGDDVEEMNIDPDRPVLSDDLVRRLGKVGRAVEGLLGDDHRTLNGW